ncbi:hypothetical protein DSO57_1032946 [Entomophthora muscae]|uniref:Uncharacterized protein n=1 Tax=Entomophthora muscae TaxID=34485 RepID=A0ACC2T087_9FUNG|nr:hypothetical protein DSO57_1032946 [Entomophthora muscae]
MLEIAEMNSFTLKSACDKQFSQVETFLDIPDILQGLARIQDDATIQRSKGMVQTTVLQQLLFASSFTEGFC